MAVIYLKHPRHGAKVAISHLEAENDMDNGWEPYDPADLTDADDTDAPVESVNELQPRRRGRRPKELVQ